MYFSLFSFKSVFFLLLLTYIYIPKCPNITCLAYFILSSPSELVHNRISPFYFPRNGFSFFFIFKSQFYWTQDFCVTVSIFQHLWGDASCQAHLGSLKCEETAFLGCLLDLPQLSSLWDSVSCVCLCVDVFVFILEFVETYRCVECFKTIFQTFELLLLQI